jgi:hypothetical protein
MVRKDQAVIYTPFPAAITFLVVVDSPIACYKWQGHDRNWLEMGHITMHLGCKIFYPMT